MRKPRNPTGKGGFVKGRSGNPGGMTPEQAKERADLRKALEGEGQAVHDALMALVREGNAQAVMYAHQQLIGKPASAPEDRKAVGDALERLTPEIVLAAFGITDPI